MCTLSVCDRNSKNNKSSTSTMYTLCVYVTHKRRLINPLSAQAQQTVGSSVQFPSQQRNLSYYAKACTSQSETVRGDPVRMRRSVRNKGNSNECSIAKILEDKELLTRGICETQASHHIKMAKLHQELTCLRQDLSRIGSKLARQENCAAHVHTLNEPERFQVCVNAVVGGHGGTGLRFVGEGDFGKHAQKTTAQSVHENWTVRQLMGQLQIHALVSQATGKTLAPDSTSTAQQLCSARRRKEVDLHTLLSGALTLCDKGFKGVNNHPSLLPKNSSCSCSKFVRSNFYLGKKYSDIESEKRFLVNHLFRWLQLQCLMTDCNFQHIIPAAWLATETEDCKTFVANGNEKQKDSTNGKNGNGITVKSMSTTFHAAVIALKNPKDMVNRLRILMRNLIYMSMPHKKQGHPVNLTDLQKCALQYSASDHKFFKDNPDLWLKEFQTQDVESKLGEDVDRKPVRGTAWPGDISSVALPTVLVALLLMLYKGHILLLDNFNPNPQDSVLEIFEDIRQKLDEEQKEATYENLNLDKIMKNMDDEVCFLFVTYSWCRHTSKEI